MSASIAIVDYGVGNLFSVARACEAAGMTPLVTNDAEAIRRASGVILPGIGAFGDAMAAIARLKLVECLRSLPSQGTPLLGVCLGMQLLMEQSVEFGRHEGLGLIEGNVVPLQRGNSVKVPHVGWSAVRRPASHGTGERWAQSLLGSIRDGEPMYFVHSYVVTPRATDAVLAETTFGDQRFCSAVARGAVSGVQFHPERSGQSGVQVYRNLAALLSVPR